MSELDILISFFPLIFISFDSLKDLRKFLGWCAIMLALICNSFQLRLIIDEPLRWIPVASILGSTILYFVQEKKIRGLTALGVLFVIQALLSTQLMTILVLLVFADTFLCAEQFTSPDYIEKNRAVQSLFRALLSFFPVVAGVLLQLQGEWLAGCVALTILMRLFSWPFPSWVENLGVQKNLLTLCVGVVSSFILWRTQSVNQEAFWGLVWLSIACFFSLGSRSTEVLFALVLGLFSLSPVVAVLATCLWPLMIREESLRYLMGFMTAVVGALIVGNGSRLLIFEAGVVAAVVSALLVARTLVRTDPLKMRWAYDFPAVLWAAAIVGVTVFFHQELEPIINPASLAFLGVCLSTYLIGQILGKKRPVIFAPMRRWGFHITILSKIKIRPKVAPQDKKILSLPLEAHSSRFFSVLESEAHLVFLLGLLGAFLIWGVK